MKFNDAADCEVYVWQCCVVS